MGSEMLSGPDLGGGFLHQLSVDRNGGPTTFTFHAQDGGSDAGAPPKGPHDVFGFAHPANPCMFGVPRCSHRRFLLQHGEAPAVRRAYNRHRFVLEAMIDQRFGHQPVPIENGLVELLERVARPLADEAIDWYVGGSTAAWLLGAKLAPRDLDLGTTRDGVDRLASLLDDCLIEPLAPTDWPSSGIVRAARAFLGTFREGVRVEWSVPIGAPASVSVDEWDMRSGKPRLLTVPFRNRSVRISRPEYALVRAAESGRADRVPALLDVVGRVGVDRDLLDRLLARSTLSEPARESLRHVSANG